MTTLGSPLRKQLENAVREARTVADAAAKDAVARLAIAAPKAPSYFSDEQKALRRRVRAHARSLGDKLHDDDTMTTARLEEAAAYEHWHRMLFGRFLVERGLLLHPDLGVPIARGELKELAEEQGFGDEWALVERFAAPSLPGVFKPDDPVLALEIDPHFQMRLRRLVTELPEEAFAADDLLGWTYQFWRAAEKEAVNEAQVKIGAAELPAVTQLFTEPYMVKFLLHNTLGAWWAGKVLAANPDLAGEAVDEVALRTACALPGVEWEYLRFVRPLPDPPPHAGGPLPDPPPPAGEGRVGVWRPAAGTFPGWPKRAAEITVCDPCCGSGHFLVEAFRILAAMRWAEEGLSPEAAARAVLRDNLFGLEIDGRCVQIAAFNVALAAWRLARGPVNLPVPHIAWVGAPPPLPKSEFVALANGDAELERGLAALHDLFGQAPLLGSLIELTGGDLVDPTRIARIEQSIAGLVEKMRGAEPERAEGALAARGMADAAAILARHFTLQATNVPYLGRGKQDPSLAAYVARVRPEAKPDLGAAMLCRMVELALPGATLAAVTPQTWLYLGPYKGMRTNLIRQLDWNFVCWLGPGAFQTPMYDFNVILTILSNPWRQRDNRIHTLDVSDLRTPEEKRAFLVKDEVGRTLRDEQLKNPDNRVLPVRVFSERRQLSQYAVSYKGIATGDLNRFMFCFWEFAACGNKWRFLQGSVNRVVQYGGRGNVIRWEGGRGELLQFVSERLGAGSVGAWLRGDAAWGQRGVAVAQISSLAGTIYSGDLFDENTAVIIPISRRNFEAIWTYCSSPEFREEVRKIDDSMKVPNLTILKVPFDLAYWQNIATEKYPNGLPEPYSDDPTQWLFHGHPRFAEPGTELHVALARLAGYRWPAESFAEMRLSAEARARMAEAATLPAADVDGLLALVPVLGKRPLSDRLRAYCAAAWGDAWTPGTEAALIAATCERAKDKPPKQLTFDAWLRTHAARQHTKLFHDRPFLWWITDARTDGFTAVTHYHRLDRANLERLAYTILGDWISRMGDDPRAEAARILQDKLARILEGEAPYDIFVRWKPLERQPIGWEPDLDDGVRLNIRPFVEAGVLAFEPNVRYSVDRGKDVASALWYHVFHGERRNDHHTSLAEKRAARAQAAE